MRKTILTLAALLALALPASSAQALFGDNYGAEPINSHPEAIQAAPAIPSDRAVWAGACDRSAPSAALGFGDLGPSGGFGERPASRRATTGGPPNGYLVPEPPAPDHCLDWGSPATYPLGANPSARIWRLNTSPPLLGDFAPSWRLPPLALAGARADGTTMLAWARNREAGGSKEGGIDGAVDNVYVDLPPGFVANPQAVPYCTNEQFSERPLRCPPASQVGVLRLFLQALPQGTPTNGPGYDTTYPVYNLEPRRGRVAELGFGYAADFAAVRLVGLARTNGDFGVTAFVGQIPAALTPISQQITIWGVPWAAENDAWRPKLGHFEDSPKGTGCKLPVGISQLSPADEVIPTTGLPGAVCQARYQPSWGPIAPFVANETDCNPAPTVTLRTDAYENPGAFTAEGDPDPSDPDWKTYEMLQAPVSGCEELSFEPSIALDPKGQGGAEVKAADSPTGLDVELTIPQNNDLPFAAPPSGATQPQIDQYVADAGSYWDSGAGRAVAHLDDTVVTLPEGMTLNPAAAGGQGACSMAQIGVTSTSAPTPPRIRFDNQPIQCPDSSKVAEVVVETPLLDEADWPKGNAYLAAQGANPFNSDFAIYIAIESPERGFIAKLAGEVVPDPNTGRLTTTFVENPELPFDKFKLRFKAGPRAPLATPQTCGTHTNESSFTSHAQPDTLVPVADPFEITSSPAGGCPTSKAARPFNLGFSAGSTEVIGGAHSPFTVRLTRPDGNQEFGNVEVTTPPGFAAKLAGVATCSDAAVKAAEARTATGDGAKEQQNPSCPDSSKIGTTTIGVGAGSSPFYAKGNVYLAGPYKGAPLSLAFIVPAVAGPFDLGVQVVRAAVKVNPVTAQITTTSDAIPQILRGVPLRIRDIRVDVDREGFALNPTDCSEKLVSGKVTGSHGATTEVSNRFQVAECARLAFKPQVSLQLFGGVTRAKYQGVRAIVRPRAGDANISGATVRFPSSAFVAQEHLQNICTRVQWAADACPKNSVYGVAEAISPLLDEPLKGNVHLRSSNNLLPDLVADLRGPDHRPIKVEVAIRNDSVKDALRNTVQTAPDTPVTYFRIQVFGGKKALIVNARNICRDKNAARVSFRAHNGRRSVSSVPVRNAKCGKWRKAQKRKVAKKRAAAKRKARAQRARRN